MKKTSFATLMAVCLLPASAIAKDHSKSDHASDHISDQVIAEQRQMLASNTVGKGFGPQSPRDLASIAGTNQRTFGMAPAASEMSLCNIHFHKNAEHKGGEFATYAGNGDGKGYQTGFVYSGQLTSSELRPTNNATCPDKQGGLVPGDTIELHYVYSSAQTQPGATLGACLSDSTMNPHLRVEAQVFVLVNDKKAGNFAELAKHDMSNGLPQAVNIPTDTGSPIVYAGSTTGPAYNEKASPLQVTWSVRPKVAKVDIATVGEWCKDNVFNEDHAHGVRNLVTNPDLLSEIES
jgi:hypothetical protein